MKHIRMEGLINSLNEQLRSQLLPLIIHLELILQKAVISINLNIDDFDQEWGYETQKTDASELKNADKLQKTAVQFICERKIGGLTPAPHQAQVSNEEPSDGMAK